MTKARKLATSNNLTVASCSRIHREHQILQGLPRYCILVDGHYLHPEGRGFCDEEFRITSLELSHSSILSDSVFNLTRGLYINAIWNSQVYFVFMLRSDISPLKNGSQNVMDELFFCFKFFWRFFRGQKFIICHPGGCDRYDPFTEIIVALKDATDEGFFDFSLKNMHKKSLGVFYGVSKSNRVMTNEAWEFWDYLLDPIFEHLEKSINCTIKRRNVHLYLQGPDKQTAFIEDDIGLKFDADLETFNFGISLSVTDYSKLHLSPTIGSTALCIATPHSEYVPQSLVIFKSYMPVVWVFILITTILFVWAQYVFQYTQCEVFSRLYSQSEVDLHRSTSPFLTVYAYFICGSPPTLLLGRLYTGKILFVIFSFSTIILSTVYLSGMTKFLSDRVSYPEIDTLETLERSDLFIQTHDLSGALDVFSQQEQSENLKAKLINTLYLDLAHVFFQPSNAQVSDYLVAAGNLSLLESEKTMLENILRNTESMVETDAFLMSVPDTLGLKQNIRLYDGILRQNFEYHLMEECLVTYPVAFTFGKFSHILHELDREMFHFFETGHTTHILRNLRSVFDTYDSFPHTKPRLTDEEALRAYDMNDLQSAFIGLVVGLFLSFLVFVAEILVDICKNSKTLNFPGRLKKLPLRKRRTCITM
ncbi:unnamed protein product [Bemisia tabaci]|uniref:Ionotropic receptor n=1 Tax=Bemisia tabaci TaxID=7038 RepID=A0A9P0F6C9_BEMTA|nr:unnamed protein product [Bemisia tabaci]